MWIKLSRLMALEFKVVLVGLCVIGIEFLREQMKFRSRVIINEILDIFGR